MFTKKNLLIAAALLVSHGLAYSFGRYLTPAKVVVTEKVQKVEVEKLVTVEHTVEKVKLVKIKDTSEKKAVVTEWDEKKLPDGTVTKHKTQTINVDKVIKEKDTDLKVVYVDRDTVHEVTKSETDEHNKTVVNMSPDWRVGALVGVDVPHLFKSPSVAYGAEVSRRVIGPIWLGAWGLSSGMGGASLEMEF